MQWLYEALTAESRWIAPSIALAALMGVATFRGARRQVGRRTAAGLNVFAGILIGTMALGHLVAVSLEFLASDLQGSPPVLYAIGLVLLVPSYLVARHGSALARGLVEEGRTTVSLNLVLAAALLVTGPVNAPLAVPAGLNALRASVRKPRLRASLALLTVAFSVVLFAGAVRFFLSGQSFEDFSTRSAPSTPASSRSSSAIEAEADDRKLKLHAERGLERYAEAGLRS